MSKKEFILCKEVTHALRVNSFGQWIFHNGDMFSLCCRLRNCIETIRLDEVILPYYLQRIHEYLKRLSNEKRRV